MTHEADKLVDEWLIERQNRLIGPKDIADLKRRFAEAMGGWVSVKERLPEAGQDVLVYCGWRMTGIWNGEDWVDEQGVYAIFHVTHWHPLPPPPTESEEVPQS